MRGAGATVVVVGAWSLIAATAQAQPPAPTQTPATPASAASPSPAWTVAPAPNQSGSAPPPTGYAPPGSYGAPPGPAPPPGYGPGYGPPAGPGVAQLMQYDSESKSPGLALALELLLFPGVGSIYAGHPQGAFITWAGEIGGVVLVYEGLAHHAFGGDMSGGDSQGATLLVAGLVTVVGFRVYGIVDSWTSATEYNADLSHRLGLTLNLAPVTTQKSVAWGPSLSLRF